MGTNRTPGEDGSSRAPSRSSRNRRREATPQATRSAPGRKVGGWRISSTRVGWLRPSSIHPPPWRTITAWSFAFPLRLWQRPHSPPTYRCSGTSARNCWTISIAWATPVAPRGWPHPRSPPRVLIGRVPPIRDWPSSMNLPPFPFSHRPRSSYSMISEIVKQSWVSATSTSWIEIPAIARASRAAVFSGYQVVRLLRFPTREPLLAWPRPSMNTGVYVYVFARSPWVIRTAAAPSVIPLQSRSRRGGATMNEPRTFSFVTAFGKWAVGFVAENSWFFTLTSAICSAVVPYSCMWRWATIAQYGGALSALHPV